ncbi:DUF6049 family protein [Amycolatopsis taiwanensis]|uniref:Glycoprotein n=1 Tax=Amycolatopsis taiwanensis TaxID=342230 RepID=A0A9W6R350_9PSEU|nr:DUF6049 family protein [Amycolatopsis taiwanensis]GLY67515.1 glycoprotein [Amycolatopsis taiwanensis]
MKRFAAVVLGVLFAVLSTPLAIAQPGPDGPRLTLDITELTPRVITPSSTTLTVAGTVTNTGDRRISDLRARLELGAKQTNERQLRAVMTGTPASAESRSTFIDIEPAVLEPGQSGQLNLTVKLDGTGGLKITAPGVYPLLININGTPDYGDQARLAALNVLLPVLGAPGHSPAQAPAQPAAVTMLWPIADTRPRIVATPYNAPTLLGDDVLASELRPGGRLDALVSSALAVQNNPQVARSLCYAIDPDLLDTVDAMSRGYEVRTRTGNVPGSGAEVAKNWLAALHRLVSGQCVIQLPYADADLSALAKVHNGDLMSYALDTGGRVQQVTGMRPRAGVVWADGPLDSTALAALNGVGVNTIIADPEDLNESQSGGNVTVGSNVRAQIVDPLATAGFGAAARRPAAAGIAPDDPAIATQNGLAALAFRGGLGTSTTKPVLIAPPRRWSVPTSELTQLLQSFGQLVDSKMLTAAPLDDLLTHASANNAGSATMNYTADDVAASTPTDVTDEMASIEDTMSDFRNAMTVDPTQQVDPDQLLLPLRYALVRNCSTAWRGSTDAAQVSVGDSRAQLNTMLGSVTVETSEVPISMASGSAPLPVFVRNNLPVQMVVRITLNNNTGLRPGAVPDRLLVPARGGLPVKIPMEALRAGKFAVTVNLSTPDGTPLGRPAGFDLRSNEYGVVTLVLTIAGGAALVLLSARQIYRRVRARRQG